MLFALDVIIIIASIWVAVEAALAMRRSYKEPPEALDADERIMATRESI